MCCQIRFLNPEHYQRQKEMLGRDWNDTCCYLGPEEEGKRKCLIHDKKGAGIPRKPKCEVFPRNPDDIRFLPGCGYRFIETI
jgi:hypothetical protein